MEKNRMRQLHKNKIINTIPKPLGKNNPKQRDMPFKQSINKKACIWK